MDDPNPATGVARLVPLTAPEGLCYVHPAAVIAVGPTFYEPGKPPMRGVYLAGGQVLIVLDTAENMAALFPMDQFVSDGSFQ